MVHDPSRISWLYGDLRRTVDQLEEELVKGDPGDMLLRVLWGRIIIHAQQIARWIVETRSIPPGKAKAVELAARAVEASRTKNIVKWWAKNRRHIATILEAEKWPERGESPREVQELVKVGPFTVHNSLHLDDRKLDTIKSLLTQAETKLRRAGSDLARVLYGDVFLVGRLKQPRTLAWYYEAGDDVYLRPHLKVGRGELHNFLHELGHRYWTKFMSGTQKQAWAARHTELGIRRPQVSLPKPGDLLPVPIKGAKETPTIVKYETDLRGRILVVLSTGAKVSANSLWNLMEHEAMARSFPSDYAATKVTEHFPEAFAMHVLGTLPPEHEEFFARTM
jgi:hypothetical protein